MNRINFDKVEILLIDPDITYRQALFGMLRAMGIRKIHQGSTEIHRKGHGYPASDIPPGQRARLHH